MCYMDLSRSIPKNVHLLLIRGNSLTKVRHIKIYSLSGRKEQIATLMLTGNKINEKMWTFTGSVEKLQIPLQSINSFDKRIFFFYRVGNLEYTAVYKVLNHIQTAPVLISYPGILLGIFDVGLLRGLGNPHPVSDHNIKTDK